MKLRLLTSFVCHQALLAQTEAQAAGVCRSMPGVSPVRAQYRERDRHGPLHNSLYLSRYPWLFRKLPHPDSKDGIDRVCAKGFF